VALTFFIGILFASGAGAVSFGIIMSAITPVIGTKKAAGVSGVVNASCGIGSAILSPTLEGTISSVGIKSTMFGFAVVVMLLMFLVFWFRRLNSRYGAGDAENEGSSAEDHEEVSVGEAFRDAFRSPDYRYLMIGFGTCGFHMTIIQTHLVSQIVSYGISESKAAMIYTVYSVAVMVGAIGCGMLCQKFHLKNVLGSVYGSRAVIVPVFIFLMPKTVISLIIFGILLGLTADSTVTPTSEIISRRFGPKSMGVLFGITFVCHQVGGFISSWLGGVLVEGTGNYNTIWMIDIVLCALAAFVSFRIRVHENE
jgi:MFS family permease